MWWQERDPLKVLRSEGGNCPCGKRNRAETDEAGPIHEITAFDRHEATRSPYFSVGKQVSYSFQAVACSNCF